MRCEIIINKCMFKVRRRGKAPTDVVISTNKKTGRLYAWINVCKIRARSIRNPNVGFDVGIRRTWAIDFTNSETKIRKPWNLPRSRFHNFECLPVPPVLTIDTSINFLLYLRNRAIDLITWNFIQFRIWISNRSRCKIKAIKTET